MTKYLLTQLLTALVPAAIALACGWLISTLLQSNHPDHSDLPLSLGAPIALLTTTFIAAQLARSAKDIVGQAIARRVDGMIRRKIRDFALAPHSIEHLIAGDFQEDTNIACHPSITHGNRTPGKAAIGQVSSIFKYLSALGSAIVLAQNFAALALCLLVAACWMRSRIRADWMALAAFISSRNNDAERSEYFADLATSKETSREVRLFDLNEWVLTRWHQHALAHILPATRFRMQVIRRQAKVITVALLCGVASFAVPAAAALAGKIDSAALIKSLLAAWLIVDLVRIGAEAFEVEFGRNAVAAFRRLENRWNPASQRVSRREVVNSIPPRLRMDNVSFGYPNRALPVLTNISVEFPPGKAVAIVGSNGAGKTSLLMLLCGLLRPTAGQLSVDGNDLTDESLPRWHQRVYAVFETPVKYPATLGENVAMSVPDRLTDLAGVEQALKAGGIEERVGAVGLGLSTHVDGHGEPGINLSGGEWQTLAISRALFAHRHGRRLLIFDEPTAHLDSREESTFLKRIRAAVADSASIIITTHRLSTARQADLIMVLQDGSITERGSHQELMRINGEYARLFRLQASRFAGDDRK